MKKRILLLLTVLIVFNFSLQAQATGDVNSSGQVDIVDALLTAQYYVGLNPPNFNAALADVNASGAIDILDALLIAQYYVGIINVFPADQDSGDIKFAASSLDRNAAPAAGDEELETVAGGINRFALDSYGILNDSPGNVFFSPVSIAYAMAMTYAGARGNTEAEMASTMHITMPQSSYHDAMNALEQSITNDPATAGDSDFILRMANSSWGQQGYTFEPEYLDTLALNYGAGMNLVDFYTDPEACRLLINDWVYQQTNQRIADLLPEDSLDSDNVLVLTNAIYFKAYWYDQFDPEDTVDSPFTNLNGSTAMVPMMNNSKIRCTYSEKTGQYQAVHLRYKYGYSTTVHNFMTIILPAEGNFQAFDNSLSTNTFNSILGEGREYDVTLAMPRFKYEYEQEFKEVLQALGMEDAFTPYVADFSGINGDYTLYIEKVFHKAFISVDEKGTEATAATASVPPPVNAPPIATMTLNRPFIYLIWNANTGAILFMGRVTGL